MYCFFLFNCHCSFKANIYLSTNTVAQWFVFIAAMIGNL